MSMILNTLKKKYEAEIEEGKVNISIMLNNPTSIPDAKFITGTSNYAHGSIHVTKIAGTYPNVHTTPSYNPIGDIRNLSKSGEGWRDPTMLSYWGSVVVEKNTTGFAMEFIGDMNDSSGGLVLGDTVISGVAAP